MQPVDRRGATQHVPARVSVLDLAHEGTRQATPRRQLHTASGQPEQKLFAGWMFASTPALSAMDDGVYDVRVLACTMMQGSSPPK